MTQDRAGLGLSIAVCVALAVTLVGGSTTAAWPASALTAGKKTLFAEDFELDIYEWTLLEDGRTPREDPDLRTTGEAAQGRNVLQFTGAKGILGLELTERVEGMVEFQVKFPSPPDDYTRMFAVGLGEDEVMLGVNRSSKFAYVTEGVWRTSEIQVSDQWHTFTYDFSGGVTRLYIDETLVASTSRPTAFDRLRLGVNGGRGGGCLIDGVIIAAPDAELSDNLVEVEIPLMGWDDDSLWPGIKVGAEVRPHGPATYRVTDTVVRSGLGAAQLSYNAADKKQWRHYQFGRHVPLPGLPQRLSLWVHGDESGSRMALAFATENSNITYHLPPVTWNGWRQVEIDLTETADSFYPPSWDWVIKHAGYEGTALSQVVLMDVPAGQSGTIYVDDIVLTTRMNSEFPHVFGVESAAEDNIIEAGNRAEFDVVVGNHSFGKVEFNVDYSLENYWGTSVVEGRVRIEAAKSGKASQRVVIDKPLPHGWYRARFALTDGDRTVASATEPVAVLRPLNRELFGESNPLGSYGGHTRRGYKVGLSEVYLSGPGDLRRADLAMLRRWRPDSEELARLETHGYSGVIFHMVPAWAFLPEDEVHAEASKTTDALAEMAADLRGLPIYYKILSEPGNSGISPERCYLVLKYVAEGLRRGDPDARIIGLNTSKFNWGRQQVVWGLGGLDYVHAVGVHPYCGARHGSAKTERVHGIGNLKSMLRLDDMIRRYNGGEPKMIWASEVGYDTDGVTWHQQADYLTRMVIEFKTLDNFGKLHYHMINDGVFGRFGIFTQSTQPKPLAVALHGVAERITGVRWLKSLHTDDNIRAYLFEQPDGRQMLAAWSVDGPDEMALPTACDSVQMMDLMGVYTQQSELQGVLSLTLTESPVFVAAPAGERLVERWVQAQTRYLEAGVGQRGRTLRVAVTNQSEQQLRGRLSSAVPHGLILSPASHQIDLGPGSRDQYEFTLSVAADCPANLYDAEFAFEADDDEIASLARTTATISVVASDIQLAATLMQTRPAPVVDGKLDDESWMAAEEITGFVDDSQGFVPEVGQSLRLLYDQEGLYVGVRYETVPGQALRAEHTERDDANLWRDECVEVFLNPGGDRDSYFQFIASVAGVQSDLRFVDAKTARRNWDEARQWDGSWQVATTRGEDYWTAELLIPWETVGVAVGASQTIGLNVSRKYAPVGDAVIHSYTPAGIPVHGVESYLPLEVDLTE